MIDATGKTVLPGLWDMHVHLQDLLEVSPPRIGSSLRLRGALASIDAHVAHAAGDVQEISTTLRRQSRCEVKESPEDRAARKEILQSVRGEGAATLELAPLAKVPRGLPPAWQKALMDLNPTSAVLDGVWRPLAKHYPKTIAAMRRTLRRVGLLTTKKRSHSLVYLFELEGDGGLWFRRGYLPATKLPKLASRLPKEFLAIYPVHDGWLDGYEGMGPRRSDEWSPLGQGPHSRDFLVTFEGHGPAILGFDLSEKQAPCYTVWTQSEPQRVRKIAREIDEWIGGRMDEFQRANVTKPTRPATALARKKKQKKQKARTAKRPAKR